MAKKVRERMVSYATYGVVLCLVLKSIFSLRTYVMLSRSFDADEGTMNGLKLNLVPITEVASDVSPLDLFLRHAKEPVIVKGALHGQPLMRADNVVEYVAQVCRDSYIDTVVYSKEVSSWAGHTDEKLMRIKDYYASYVKNSSNEELRYATSATFGMPFMCPALQHDMLVPGLASKPLPTGGAFRNYAQPTIFMGPAWSRSELHIDMMLMPFWLGVYAGTKRFRVIAFEDNLEHFGVDRGGFGSGRILSPSGKALEIFDPDVQEFPELQDVRIYEGEVKAGDVIYVPSGALHGILNTEATFAATSNSLWPPLTSHYAEVCTKSHFARRCKRMLKDTYLGACEVDGLNPFDDSTIEEFTKCALHSKANIELGQARSYVDKKGFRDIFLWELFRFTSYEDFCLAVCSKYLELDYTKSKQGPEQEAVCKRQCKVLGSRNGKPST